MNPNNRDLFWIMIILGFAWGITYGLVHSYTNSPCPDRNIIGYGFDHCLISNEPIR